MAYGKLQWHDWSDDPAARNVEPSWHLSGMVVNPAWRRRGIGMALTRARVNWLRERDPSAALWYCTNANNAVSVALHATLEFTEVTRDFSIPRLTFQGGIGLLCRLNAGDGHG